MFFSSGFDEAPSLVCTCVYRFLGTCRCCRVMQDSKVSMYVKKIYVYYSLLHEVSTVSQRSLVCFFLGCVHPNSLRFVFQICSLGCLELM